MNECSIILSDDSDVEITSVSTSPLTSLKTLPPSTTRNLKTVSRPLRSNRKSTNKPRNQLSITNYFNRPLRIAPPDDDDESHPRIKLSTHDTDAHLYNVRLDDLSFEKTQATTNPAKKDSPNGLTLGCKRTAASKISPEQKRPKVSAKELLDKFAPKGSELKPPPTCESKSVSSADEHDHCELTIPGPDSAPTQELRLKSTELLIRRKTKDPFAGLGSQLSSTQFTGILASTPHKPNLAKPQAKPRTPSPLCPKPKQARSLNLNPDKPRVSITANWDGDSLDLFNSDMSDWSCFEDSAVKPELLSRALISGYGRYKVLLVDDSGCEKTLTLLDDSGAQRYCVLTGFWIDTEVHAGDTVNVIGQFQDDFTPMYIDMKSANMIVVNPDYLVSGSVIASATQCVRRAVLANRYRGTDAANKYTLLGTILHEVFQLALQMSDYSSEKLRHLTDSVSQTPDHAHLLYAINMPDKELRHNMEEYIPTMLQFLQQHVSITDTSKTAKHVNKNILITQVTDIEDTVWSPRFGMKGKIDVTVNRQLANQSDSREQVPLELKTGRASYSAEHKGQVTMYSMMLAERDHPNFSLEDLNPGLLVYLKDGSMQEVNNAKQAVSGLVQLRNRLSDGLLRSVTEHKSDAQDQVKYQYTVDRLPEPIDSARSCSMCPYLLTCSLHHRLFDKRKLESGHSLTKLSEEVMSHLNDSDIEYFVKWSSLLLVEASCEAKWKTTRNIWCQPLSERIAAGTCLAGIKVQSIDHAKGVYTHHCSYTKPESLGELHLIDHENVIISEQSSIDKLAVSIAQCKQISAGKVDLVCDRKLNTSSVYYADRYDMYNSDSTGFTNLARLLDDAPASARVRRLVIDKHAPIFDEDPEFVEEKLVEGLNSSQRHAVERALQAKDYLVIKGYPGTGKTSTIVALVRTLRFLGLSVLVTSYTNSAVDTVLLKLLALGEDLVRLGRAIRAHPDLYDRCHETLTAGLKTGAELDAFYNNHHLYGSTCITLNSAAVFKRRKFDVCIIDEASQIMQPYAISSLFQATRYILVGDNKQLPPLIKHPYSKANGMDETLLDLLDSTHPKHSVELVEQYRMNSPINQLANDLVYNGKLVCATEAVALSHIAAPEVKPEESWLLQCISDNINHAIVWINTINCKSTNKFIMSNIIEVDLVCKICQALTSVQPEDIGVITPYQAQLQLLRKRKAEGDLQKNIEVNTVDQYQGRDKSVVVVSFVRTNDQDGTSQSISKDSGILSDLRRLNVAITRAKHKLIVIGHIPTLLRYEPIASMLKFIPQDNIICPTL